MRQERWPRPGSLSDRLQVSILVGLIMAAVPWMLTPLGRAIRRSNGPGDPAALLWMPVDSWYVVLPFMVSVVAGAVLGRLIFLRRKAAKAALVGVAAIVVSSILATALSWSSIIKVYPDRVELFQGRFPAPAAQISESLGRATAIQVYCYVETGRRKQPIAHLAYLIYLPELGAVDLGTAGLNPERPSDSRLGLLQRLDDSVLGSVPGVGDGAQSGECLRLLRGQLGADQFTIARRLIRLDDETYLRLYAEPHEAWNGKVDR